MLIRDHKFHSMWCLHWVQDLRRVQSKESIEYARFMLLVNILCMDLLKVGLKNQLGGPAILQRTLEFTNPANKTTKKVDATLKGGRWKLSNQWAAWVKQRYVRDDRTPVGPVSQGFSSSKEAVPTSRILSIDFERYKVTIYAEDTKVCVDLGSSVRCENGSDTGRGGKPWGMFIYPEGNQDQQEGQGALCSLHS